LTNLTPGLNIISQMSIENKDRPHDTEISIEQLVASNPKIRQALDFATTAHSGQTRDEGIPYVSHCIEVAKIIYAEWGITTDENLVDAALLHDTVEDTDTAIDQIRLQFGDDVAMLVDGVSKLRSEKGENTDKETLRKVVNTAYLDPRVLLLKLADRLHNMRTVQFVAPEKQKPKAVETLVYAKMAESLGLWQVKLELEDISFNYLDPAGYLSAKEEVDNDPRLHPLFVNFWTSNLERILAKNGLPPNVHSAVNGYFFLKEKRRKLAVQGEVTMEGLRRINDLIGFRVILPSLKDCHMALGIIQEEYGEYFNTKRLDLFTGRNTRTNGYSAIQSTLDLPQGSIEIALVTPDMDDFNKWGIVSRIRKGETDLRHYARVLVFTPSDDVVFLPEGATAIDFAYEINPRLGAEAVGVKINGREVSVSSVIPNGSTVEILVGKPRIAPDTNYAFFCLPKTAKIIETQLLQQQREQQINIGAAKVEEIMTRLKLPNLEDIKDMISPLLYRLGCQDPNGLFFKIGSGILSEAELIEELSKSDITKESLGLTTIRVAGKDEPKILETLATLIGKNGGNIFNWGFQRLGDHYWLRLVVENLDDQSGQLIREEISRDRRFEIWSVA